MKRWRPTKEHGIRERFEVRSVGVQACLVIRLGFFSRNCHRIRNRGACLLHRFDIGENRVERHLDGVSARLGQVGQIAFGSGSCNIEARDLTPYAFKQLSCLANDGVLRVDGSSERASRLVSRAQLLAEAVERPDVFIEHSFAGRNRLQQLFAPRHRLPPLLRPRRDALFELQGRFAQTQDISGKRSRTFDESRMRGARGGGFVVQLRGGSPGGAKTSLCVCQRPVSRQLLLFEPRVNAVFFTVVGAIADLIGLPSWLYFVGQHYLLFWR